jgi:SAM-dependent methyltransferase
MKSDHYSGKYYQNHYAQVLGDSGYYDLLSKYWHKVVIEPAGLGPNARILDYGCGLGQVSAAAENVSYYDASQYAREFLKHSGKPAFDRVEDIPSAFFDAVLCSHSLEHYDAPKDYLETFKRYANSSGRLILVLPVEVNLGLALQPDSNQHFYCWTFQTLTNLLLRCGWTPVLQRNIFGPFMLRTSKRWFASREAAVGISKVLGKLVHNYPSLLTVASVNRRVEGDKAEL